MLESEYFPVMTFILAALMLGVFLFTANEMVTPVTKSIENKVCQISCPKTCKSYFDYYFDREVSLCVEADYSNCVCIMPKLSLYESLLGFIPKSPRIYSAITYALVHDSMSHLFFNLVFLFIAGLAIEETLGKWNFLFVFIFSAFVAVPFDILGRLLTGISFKTPFIGASGGIFGLLALASIIKSNERIPTVLNILLLIALIANFQPMISWLLSAGSAFGPQITVMAGAMIFIAVCSILLLMPGFPSIPIALLIFLINALMIVLSDYSTATSNVGHLGGVIGGIISLFILSERKKH
jgi:membrane associated rhomboid family serine protease